MKDAELLEVISLLNKSELARLMEAITDRRLKELIQLKINAF
jgi:hypothetical protein